MSSICPLLCSAVHLQQYLSALPEPSSVAQGAGGFWESSHREWRQPSVPWLPWTYRRGRLSQLLSKHFFFRTGLKVLRSLTATYWVLLCACRCVWLMLGHFQSNMEKREVHESQSFSGFTYGGMGRVSGAGSGSLH